MDVRPLAFTPAIRDALVDILIETVAHGGSVSFMHPLSRDAGIAFWDRALAAAERGERVILGAFNEETLVGTVTVHLDCPPNQPHRGELAKLMVHPAYRGRGYARSLLIAAEMHAARHERTLLVLDTATDGGAMGLYESHGFVPAGIIPDYALKPHGGYTGTMIYWKRIGA